MRKKWLIFITFLLGIGIMEGANLRRHITIFNPPQVIFSGKYRSGGEQGHYQALAERDCCPPNSAKIFPTKLRILMWNLHKGEDVGWEATLQDLSSQADLVLLQETSPKLENSPSCSEVRIRFPYRLYGNGFAYKKQAFGVGIFSKFFPHSFYVTSMPEPLIRLPKVAVAEEFVLGGKHLLVVNMHLVNFDPTARSYNKQLAEMHQIIKQYLHKNTQGAVILAGDFNAWNMARVRILKGVVESLNLEEVQFSPDLRLKFRGKPLDFIFVKNLRVDYAKTIATKSSDHNPLLLELSPIGNTAE